LRSERRLEHARGGADRITRAHSRHRPVQRVHIHERLVALHVQDEVELTKRFIGNDFCDTLGAGLVLGGREDRLVSRPFSHGGDFARVSRDDQAVTHAGCRGPSHDPEDERLACQWQEWLAGKAAGTEPRRDHAEDGHGATYKIRAAEHRPTLIAYSHPCYTRHARRQTRYRAIPTKV